MGVAGQTFLGEGKFVPSVFYGEIMINPAPSFAGEAHSIPTGTDSQCHL